MIFHGSQLFLLSIRKLQTVFLVLCVASLSQQFPANDFVDGAIYTAIHKYLDVKYPNEPVLTKCMTDHFRNNKIADDISVTEIIGDPTKIQDTIEVHEKAARIKCSIAIFSSSPFGIIILVAVLLIVVLLLCCLIKCIWC